MSKQIATRYWIEYLVAKLSLAIYIPADLFFLLSCFVILKFYFDVTHNTATKSELC
jgi:hypothetical protein